MRILLLGLYLFFLNGVIFFLCKSFAYSINSPEITQKVERIFERQGVINAKLKEVEDLLEQIRIRVYRKTGFYGD